MNSSYHLGTDPGNAHPFWQSVTRLAANNDPTGLVTSTTTVTDLIPADVYSQLVLEGLHAQRNLAGVVGAVVEDMTAMAGSTVQVPIYAARTAQGPVTEGSALTDTASSFSTATITLDKFGDFEVVNNEVFEDEMIFDVAAFLRAQTRALAQAVDNQVYTELETATPDQTTTLATAGDLSDLYDQIVDLKAAMKGDNVEPSHLIVHPDHEAQFLKDTNEGIKFQNISVRDGQLLSVAGLEVVVSSLANANTTTLSETQAIVIDQTRAVGEAWGRRPTTIVDETTNADSDQTRLITWLRYGTDEIDTTAIGHVTNPAS